MRVYGSQGLGASLEDVAADADVTTEEILAEFGSVEGLQSACTSYVFEVVEETHGSLNPQDDMFKHLVTADEYEPVVRYLVMCLRAGGDLARHVIEQMTADAEQNLARQAQHGVVVESADPKARARYLTLSQAGALVMEFAIAEPGATSMEVWQNHVATTTLPALELYSHGMLTDGGAMLEEYKKSVVGQGATP
ncbi:hypothetical protein D4740_09720 [Actinomyces sp. 2119]|uniref:hypothetical protein n=1 Tax=Actinomyces sp. 2119 TaxID=2321393 RepID=UPI000E6C8F84|nr:hypothetical protein [Actinomyces sp. 2119]RJF41185.1 hypothetical protein D4740_09720 [Actinomyces sp. 2119]